jgi:hypothetical protein
LIRAPGKREVLQMRIDLGVLQLETSKRPDGERPGGADTYFDHLLVVSVHEGTDFVMSEEQCGEADREFLQFYQRRVCWLALREYQRAVADADHNLAFMDFVQKHSPSEEWTQSHEQYRPFIISQRTEAAAMAALESQEPSAAIEVVNAGLERLREFFQKYDIEDRYDDDELVQKLISLRESMRSEFEVGRTLNEQLADAIASEQYELAAKLRDRLRTSESAGPERRRRRD